MRISWHFRGSALCQTLMLSNLQMHIVCDWSMSQFALRHARHLKSCKISPLLFALAAAISGSSSSKAACRCDFKDHIIDSSDHNRFGASRIALLSGTATPKHGKTQSKSHAHAAPEIALLADLAMYAQDAGPASIMKRSQ